MYREKRFVNYSKIAEMYESIINSSIKTKEIEKNNLIGINGLPTKEFINYIKNHDGENILEFIYFLYNSWKFPKKGIKIFEDENKYYLELHTYRWERNNILIDNILSNSNLMKKIKLVSKYPNGHYYFIIDKNEIKNI